MSRNKTLKVVTTFSVAMATILAWLSGFFIMQIVYNSIVAAITFGTIWAIIVYFECRFSYISLRSDGRVSITKMELKSNLWQIIAATLVALLVSVPIELRVYKSDIDAMVGTASHNLEMRMQTLGDLFATHWLPMILIGILIIVVFQAPIFARMASDDK